MGDSISNPIRKRNEIFPKTLHEFNYKFDEDGRLRDITTGKGFEFNVKAGDHDYNQDRYEALGEILNDYVYELLKTETKLEKHYIPVDGTESEPKSFIFMSPGALDNLDKLMIIIHGSGVVRAGQWARRLIINDCLETGTQIPYIKRALADGYGVLVLNTNHNYGIISGRQVKIRGSESPENHILYVYDNFIKNAQAQKLMIVAHSYGGIVTVNLLNKRPAAMNKITAIAFTDSVHGFELSRSPPQTVNFVKKIAKNWISSDEPLDTVLQSRSSKDCPCVSAGHVKHEMTSASAINSVFNFLKENSSSSISREEL